MIAYLDTHVVIFLALGDTHRLTHNAAKLIDDAELLISPMVLIELDMLHEIGRIKPTGREVQLKVEQETGLRVCDLPFQRVAEVARDEAWTRDPFDRVIVAHAKAKRFSYLISADEKTAIHYPRTIW